MSNIEENKELIRQFTTALWEGRPADDIHVEDAIIHTPKSPSGLASFEETAAYLRAAMPDLSVSTNMLFAEEDRVMQHFSVTGTHTGAPLFNIPPSGSSVNFAGMNIFRIANGKITERWSMLDAADVFQQLTT